MFIGSLDVWRESSRFTSDDRYLSSIALMSQPRSEGTEAVAKTIHNCYHGNWNQSETMQALSHVYTDSVT